MALMEFQNTPLIQQLSLTGKLGINETTTILKDLNINTISKEINSTANSNELTKLSNKYFVPFRKLKLFPS
jgi:hypothetical protein